MRDADAREQAADTAGPAHAPSERARAAMPTESLVTRYRGRRRWLAAGAVGLAVVLAAGLAWLNGAFGTSGSSHAGTAASGYGTSTAVVTRRGLSSQTSVGATLGYAGSYTVIGKARGTITWLPAQGTVIRQGQVAYRIDNGTPVVLLYGSVPDWRALKVGMTGQDVTQLNHDLVALGYANSGDIAGLGWDHFSWYTRYGLQRLLSALGESKPSGTLPLGQAVFEPTALRVTTVNAQLGGPVSGTVLAATSTTPVVTIDLDASRQSEVKDGDKVTVTLPNGVTAPGVISSVGTVATSPSSGASNPGSSGNSGSSVTIPVEVTLTHPKATGGLDEAPVTAHITTGSVSNALVVPVDALLAQARGGYAVEVTGPHGHHLVPVTLGLFDDTDGLVQVAGSGLSAGQHVVVPAT